MKKIYMVGKHTEKYTVVDDVYYAYLNMFTWHYNQGYARTFVKGKYIFMHQLVALPLGNMVVDHINHNRLDNRKENLRLATRSQNSANSKTKRKYKCVYWRPETKKYEARLRFDNKIVYLGLFEDENKAAKAYNEKALELFGEFAYLNEIEGE